MHSAVSLSRIYYAIKIDNSWIIGFIFGGCSGEMAFQEAKFAESSHRYYPTLCCVIFAMILVSNNGYNPMNFVFTCYLLRLWLSFFYYLFLVRIFFFLLQRMKKGCHVNSISYIILPGEFSVVYNFLYSSL